MNFKNDLRIIYDKYALERETSEMEDWKVTERSQFIELLIKENKETILEIGAGPGRDSKFFQDQQFKVTCIDLSPGMIRLCKLKGLNAQVMDMTAMDFADNTFDAVYSMNSLLHLQKNEFVKVLGSVNSILRTNGVFYLGMYGGYDFEGIWEKDGYVPHRFFSFFTDEKLEEEVNKVFDVLSFDKVIFGAEKQNHYQSLFLKKRTGSFKD